jgi:hypothetical protein
MSGGAMRISQLPYISAYRTDFDRFDSHADGVAGLVPATSNVLDTESK